VKKIIQYLFTVSLAVFCIYWIYRGKKIGDKEWLDEKQKEIKGKIIKILKPEGYKVIVVYLSDSSKYCPFTNRLNDELNVGDSIYKAKNSYRLIIFKNCKLSDTTSFLEGGEAP